MSFESKIQIEGNALADARVGDMMHRIEAWLLEMDYKISHVPNNNAKFNFAAKDAEGLTVNIFQNVAKADQVIIATGAILPQELQDRLKVMERDRRTKFLWELRFGLLNAGVGFSPITEQVSNIRIETAIYEDGLTHDGFAQRLFLVRRMLRWISWMVERELGAQSPSTTNPLYG